MTKLGRDIKTRTMHEDETSEICVNFLIIVSVFAQLKLVLSLEQQLMSCVKIN